MKNGRCPHARLALPRDHNNKTYLKRFGSKVPNDICSLYSTPMMYSEALSIRRCCEARKVIFTVTGLSVELILTVCPPTNLIDQSVNQISPCPC